MTEQPSATKTIRCPGCKQIVELSKYGEHMLASNQMAHSNVGVITPVALAETPYYPVAGVEPAKRTKEGKHFLIRWSELWRRDAYGMVTFGFTMFCLGLLVEWYYFVR